MRIHSFLGSLYQTAVIAQTQIVIGAEVENLPLRAVYCYSSFLRSDDDALVLVQTGVLDVLQLLLEMLTKVSVHDY